MAGNNKQGMVIQDRDRHLLEELATLRVVDREQATIVAGFGSITRVNTRLLQLTKAGLLRRFFLATTMGGAKAVYALTAKGAWLVDVPLRGPRQRRNSMLVAGYFVQHQLAVNEVYCALKYQPIPLAGVVFRRWLSFFAPVAPGLRLIPDGYVELETPSGLVAAFLEVDLGSEHGPVWREKVENYLQFALREERGEEALHRPFRVLVITHSERRLRALRKVVVSKTEKIFWFADFNAIRRDGLFASVWSRPGDETKQSLIKANQNS
jgi:protein involved in plasmid replication-relaxation